MLTFDWPRLDLGFIGQLLTMREPLLQLHMRVYKIPVIHLTPKLGSGFYSLSFYKV